ncbi:TetR/AcrR family transcriptional regulator C-terminal ligand-binding domain-containing protein [Streptomyces sp. DSM 41527]|uniref:TetR/AcrR family transcriptional regulator C-terminal ligand-binding domain-containing protein n=1 Tax=Streptomyces mooreae TaxID=3075523 RepID=A0ABU2T9C5_9ACTN|nr:TetR/AcrR family transcriptional regulator C-terminal ligand-binding domain-containing protein [Streptomyces sp. DSM 41527]MDT0457539.1 TetR/AcrR family transcriptional regulator C-terminal ligand-binding domain-containing protein [Streptomyces sp. DSM 41527]
MPDETVPGNRRESGDPPPTPGTRRPGGRTARTRAAVRDAVLAGLTEHGYPGLTVEYVAEHSGVHKTTLYRRWKDVEGLVADALDLAGEDSWVPPDTGSLEGDLRALAREVVASFTDPAVAASGSAMIAAAFQSERAAVALRDYYTERFTRCEVLVERAVRRGELPAAPGTVPTTPDAAPPDTAPPATGSPTTPESAIDAGALVRSVSAPLFFRLFITREPVDDSLADQAVAATLAAARAGAFTTGTTGTTLGTTPGAAP